MPRSVTLPRTGSVSAAADRAIACVLQAERDARIAVLACERQSESELQVARERARVIAERAAVRVARVHRAVEARLEAALARIDTQRSELAADANDAPADPARLAAAVQQLALELTRDPRAVAQASRAPDQIVEPAS
jgi:hypothetical protein